MIVCVWGRFGGLGFYLGLEFDIGLFVFCFRGFFELFVVEKNVLKPWFCIVVIFESIKVDQSLHFQLQFNGHPVPLPAWFTKGRNATLTRFS